MTADNIISRLRQHMAMDRDQRGLLIVLAAGLVMGLFRYWILPEAMPGLWRGPPFAAIDLALLSILLTVALGVFVSTLYRMGRAVADTGG